MNINMDAEWMPSCLFLKFKYDKYSNFNPKASLYFAWRNAKMLFQTHLTKTENRIYLSFNLNVQNPL